MNTNTNKATDTQKTNATIDAFSYILYDKVVKETLPPVGEVESEDVRRERKVQEISETLKKHLSEIREGGKLFISLDQNGSIKPILAKLAKATPETVVAPDFFTEEEFLTLMQKAVDIYKSGSFIEASSMFTFLMNLFPNQVQPYIGYATTLWQQSGVNDAANYYSIITELLPNPLLLLYAADCYRASGDIDKAKNTLQHGIELCEKDEQTFAEVKKNLDTALEKLDQSKSEVHHA